MHLNTAVHFPTSVTLLTYNPNCVPPDGGDFGAYRSLHPLPLIFLNLILDRVGHQIPGSFNVSRLLVKRVIDTTTPSSPVYVAPILGPRTSGTTLSTKSLSPGVTPSGRP